MKFLPMSDERKNDFQLSKQKLILPKDQHNWIRPVVQTGFVLFSIFLGLQFHSFVLSLSGPIHEPVSTRPAAVEAYLPISSLMSLVYFIKTGILNLIHPAGLVIFTLTLVLALSVRRGFCSWVCPIGTAEEWVHKIGKKVFGRNLPMPKWLDMVLRLLKYTLLSFFVYHIFLMPITALREFIYGPYNRVADIKMYLLFSNISTTALTIIGILVLLSMLFKNFLCRYLCPYGALLGLFSILSPARIRRNVDNCISCGRCKMACPNQIDVDKMVRVTSMECTACFSCIGACKVEGAIGFSLLRKKIGISLVAYAVIVTMAFFFSAQIAQTFDYWQSETSLHLYRSLYNEVAGIRHP